MREGSLQGFLHRAEKIAQVLRFAQDDKEFTMGWLG
jgi:hypothetical protein